MPHLSENDRSFPRIILMKQTVAPEKKEVHQLISHKLLEELHKLNRADKLRVIQMLVGELAVEEEVYFTPGATYELVTPYGNEAAAQVLYDALQATDKKAES